MEKTNTTLVERTARAIGAWVKGNKLPTPFRFGKYGCEISCKHEGKDIAITKISDRYVWIGNPACPNLAAARSLTTLDEKLISTIYDSILFFTLYYNGYSTQRLPNLPTIKEIAHVEGQKTLQELIDKIPNAKKR